jgi:cell division protein FtsQ
MRKYNWKKILVNTFWVLAGIGAIVLLGAAMQQKNRKRCTGVKIEITGAERHMFIDEKDVMDMLRSAGAIAGTGIASLNLRQMESMVEKNPWVKNAEMFLDNTQVLQVTIEERQPVARVFTLGGNSFYLDSNSMRLPLSDKLSARVPIFTGFPSDKEILSKPDSALLHNVVAIGKYILADSFWMAQVAQVDITPQSGFELVPVVGDHIVAMGDAGDLDRKFNRLNTFYQQAWLQHGINTYERLDIQYENQVVAIRKGTMKARIDSARVQALMQSMAEGAALGLLDSTRINNPVPVNRPAVIKDSVAKTLPVTTPAKTTAAKPNSATVINNKATNKPLSNVKKATTKKTVARKPAAKKKTPRAVMNKNK